jgi:hypothetical protein
VLLTFLLYTLLLALYVAATFVVADVAKATYKHYSRGNEHHPLPFPIHYAFIVAVVEVCYDKPLAFHQSRLAAVDRAERRRLDRIEDSMLRHPSNFRARQHAMSTHPSTAPAYPGGDAA